MDPNVVDVALEPDNQSVYNLLARDAKLPEVSRVTTYFGSLKQPDGGSQTVTVQIHDAGPAAGASQFWVVATDESGRVRPAIPKARWKPH